MKNKVNIPAIHDKDLTKILEGLGLSDKLNRGELTCLNCSKTIDLFNMGGLIARNEQIEIICNDPECLATSTIKNER